MIIEKYLMDAFFADLERHKKEVGN